MKNVMSKREKIRMFSRIAALVVLDVILVASIYLSYILLWMLL